MLDVLVAEDDAMIGLLLAELLANMGFRVCGIARSRRETVEAALRLKPDCMLVDACLGSDSGVAAVAEIQRQGPVPHVFMSGAQVEGVQNAPLLLKPFTDVALQRAIKLAMRNV